MSRKKSNNVNCRATILNAIHQDNLAIKCIPDKFKNLIILIQKQIKNTKIFVTHMNYKLSKI